MVWQVSAVMVEGRPGYKRDIISIQGFDEKHLQSGNTHKATWVGRGDTSQILWNMVTWTKQERDKVKERTGQ